MQESVKNQSSKEFAEHLMYGKLKELVLPSGYTATIREQNGNDDDIISNQATARDLTNMNMFISSLVIETNLPFAIGGKLSIESVRKMLLRDKYFILFSSRIHSMGNDIKFTYDWGSEEGGIVNYTDDLNNYIWDYTKPVPEIGEKDYYQYRIQAYNHDLAYKPFEHQLSSGKLIRFKHLDGHSELYLMKLPIDQQTKNMELKARDLEQKIDGEWQKVENFMFFSKRDMAELHKIVGSLDPNFNGITELENPLTQEVIKFPIISAKDFFYPEEI